MNLKKCTTCLESKAVTEFYRHESTKDRLFPECKRCSIARAKIRRNGAKRQAILEWHREHNKSTQVAAKRHLCTQEWREKNPVQYRAQYTLRNAVQRGLVEKGTRCEFCGGSDHIQAHHPDYDAPLSVV